MGLKEMKEKAKLPKERKVYVLPKKSKKKLALEGLEKNIEGNEPSEQTKWYEKIMKHETPVCWETNDRIDIRDKKGWQGSIAHVLPKSLFPSVATHPMNYMILKMWGGTHGQYDSSWENASKMKIWPYACGIFNVLYPLLTAEEKRKLPDIILQEIKPELYNK